MLSEAHVIAALRRTWQPVAISSLLPGGRVMGCTLLEVELVVARFADGTVLAADVACPHKGARLSAGTIQTDELMCPYHGWRFTTDGACRSIPSLLEPNPEKLALSRLRTYRVQERYGFVWVKLDDQPMAGNTKHELPNVPEFEDPQWNYQIGPATPFRCGWRREVENYLDMTHFAFAHGETLGACADTRVPEMKITLHSDGFQMDAPFPSLATAHEPPGKLQSAHHRRQRSWLPNFTTIRQSFPDGDERVLVHVPSPNTRTTCTCFWSLAISPGFRGPPPKAQLDFAIRVLDEDRRMCELQMPAEVPINPGRGGWGVLVTPGDTLANTFQKQLRRWLQDVPIELPNESTVSAPL
jgi:phenylpropionate dioxygenase-like ring-hydroxylating dioxygenase large terminal subunit